MIEDGSLRPSSPDELAFAVARVREMEDVDLRAGDRPEVPWWVNGVMFHVEPIGGPFSSGER